MKRIILLFSLIILGACNDLTYDFAHNSELKNSEWQDAKVPFSTAIFCKENNISFESYQALQNAGITNLNDVKNISQTFRPDAFTAGDDEDSSAGAEFFRKIAQGLQRNDFSSIDILHLRQRAVILNDSGTASNLGVSDQNIMRYASDILNAAKKVHTGESPDSVIKDYAQASRQALRNEEVRNEQEIRQRQQREENDFLQEIKNKFGVSASNQCSMGVARNLFFFLRADPYAYKGQCVTLDIFPYGPGIKYISSNELLLYDNFLIVSDSHIRLGTPLLAIAVEPIQYTTALGERKIPVTFKIISQP